MKKERLEMISDGVIVIIMTLMVFEIKLPEINNGVSYISYIPLLRHVGIFAMSFLVLAVMWINHHQIFIGVEKVTPKIVWLNFLLLFFMSLIPLPTKALGQNIYEPVNNVFYGFILCCNSIAFTLLQNEVKTGNFIVSSDSQIHKVFCYGTATHYLKNETNSNVWTVVGSYDFELKTKDSKLKITKMKFNLKYTDGNNDLARLAQELIKK